MVRAVYRDGVIYPLDPVPEDWEPGLELRVEPLGLADDEASSPTAEELDAWGREVADAAALCDPADWERLERNLAEADLIAKEYVRREMGLP